MNSTDSAPGDTEKVRAVLKRLCGSEWRKISWNDFNAARVDAESDLLRSLAHLKFPFEGGFGLLVTSDEEMVGLPGARHRAYIKKHDRFFKSSIDLTFEEFANFLKSEEFENL